MQNKAELMQHHIVHTAQKLFLEYGLSATSMDLVAKRAGVTKQTVYRYFSSKELLFTAVLSNIRGDEPNIYTFGNGDIKLELSNFATAFLAFHLTPTALGIYRLVISEGGSENLGNVFNNQGPKKRIKPLVDFIAERFPNVNDAEFCAQMFASMVLAPRNHILIQGKQKISQAKQLAHVGSVVSLFLHGVNAK